MRIFVCLCNETCFYSQYSVSASNDSDTGKPVAQTTEISAGSRVVEITVHSVRDLYTTEVYGKLDPYLIYQLGRSKVRTPCKANGGQTCSMNFVSTLPYGKDPTLRSARKVLLSR